MGWRLSSVERFEDLRIWQDARALVQVIYSCLGDESKGAKDWGFKHQIQTAAVSIMNNIAEGFERKSDKDFARFLDIAKGSCGEVRSMLYLAQDMHYMPEATVIELRNAASSLSMGIASLTKHLRKS